MRSRCYGFVSYKRHEEAELAILRMNGAWIEGRQIRTNWAMRRTPQVLLKDAKASSKCFYTLQKPFGDASATSETPVSSKREQNYRSTRPSMLSNRGDRREETSMIVLLGK